MVINMKNTASKSAKTRQKLIGLILIICGIVLIVFGISTPKPQLFTQADVYGGEISSNDVYEFNDVLVIDCYATTTYTKPTNPDEAYYAVAFFEDDSETAYLASLCVDESSKEMYSYLENYYNNDELEIGDCYINMCVSKMSLDTETDGYYDDAVQYCTENFENVEDSGLKLNFEFENADEFPDYVKSEKTNKIFMFAIAAFMIVCGIFLTVSGFKKPKEQEPMPEADPSVYAPQAQNAANTDANVYYQPTPDVDANGYYVLPSDVNGNDYSQNS